MALDFEGLGVFYLGRRVDAEGRDRRDEPLLYDARDLTTHAVCVGMTGSGKTGLCLDLLEEAAIDGIPAIAIDPKGDLGNLLLTFPKQTPADFAPWIDPAEAERASQTAEAFAEATARTWREGQADWGMSGERIARLEAACERVIFTPGSRAGRPLSVLSGLDAPPGAGEDEEAATERIAGVAGGLLALLGLPADPIRSREHILIATLLVRAAAEGRRLDLPGLVREIQTPPLERVGALDLESFYPRKDRLTLSGEINNLLAAPGFGVWLEGEPLDAARLLRAPDGRPRLSVISIAHLSDAERMFVVTLILGSVVSWVRRQPGTGSLRAILFMDEILGFFPPTAVPPSKAPMLTLLKQARAHGLGVVLATQNPVDLDYKGLSNAGTWFIGRLQTERDRARLIDGLESAGGAGSLDRAEAEKTIGNLGKRVFLMRNVHEDAPALFRTRWTLSYLRGPLTREEIRRLAGAQAPAAAPPAAAPAAPAPAGGSRPVVPVEAGEVFAAGAGSGGARAYRPVLYAEARLHYVHAAAKVDLWQEAALKAAIPGSSGVEANPEWAETGRVALADAPAPGAQFAPLPGAAARAKSWDAWKRQLAGDLYSSRPLTLLRGSLPSIVSQPGESEAEFTAKMAHAARERRDERLEALRARYAPKIAALQERRAAAEGRVAREQADVSRRATDTAISLGATVLGALFGRKLASAGGVGRAATTLRTADRTRREAADVEAARAGRDRIDRQLEGLDAEFRAETARLIQEGEAGPAPVERIPLAPRKTDITIQRLCLLWEAAE